jgi:hypothetical protein
LLQPIDTAVGVLCDARHVQQVLTKPKLQQDDLDALLGEMHYTLSEAKLLAWDDVCYVFGEADDQGFAAGCVNAEGSCLLEGAGNVSRLFGLLRLGGATLKGAELESAWV